MKVINLINIELFNNSEPRLLHLCSLWNVAESNTVIYNQMFEADPHELAALIGSHTTYADWQEFLSDSRVQTYIDRIIYTRMGTLINRLTQPGVHLSQADSARLSTAIKYRDDHRPDFAVPVQYIYMQTPLTYDEEQFLPAGGKVED